MSFKDAPPRDTWWQLVLRAWGHWLHFGYAALLIGGYFALGLYETRDARLFVAYVSVFVYVLVLLGLLAYFIISYSRKARYAEAMICIHAAIHRLRDISWHLDCCFANHSLYENEKIKDSMRSALDAVAQAFSIASAVSNRVCIKMLSGSGADHVNTLCRDSISHMKYKDQDEAEGTRHRIDMNTAYQIIIGGKQRYFLNNNLPLSAEQGLYRNTSQPEGAVDWQLPYVATLVLPIRYVLKREESKDIQPAQLIQIKGLLAIDSNARGTYRKRYDIDMGAIVADALFPVLDRWDRIGAVVNLERAQNVPT